MSHTAWVCGWPDGPAVRSGEQALTIGRSVGDLALELASELGLRPLVAHCHLGLGRLLRRTGEDARAREHLATATTLYRAMDTRFWLEQAEAEMTAMT